MENHNNDSVIVASYRDPIDAYLAKDRLQASGIVADIPEKDLARSPHAAFTVAFDGVHLRVARDDFGRARSILNQFKSRRRLLSSEFQHRSNQVIDSVLSSAVVIFVTLGILSFFFAEPIIGERLAVVVLLICNVLALFSIAASSFLRLTRSK